MKKRLIIIAAGIGLLAILGVAWVYRPYPKPNLDRVHPRVRQLQEPLRSLRVGYYLDGGSISLNMVDAQGTALELAVPVWDDGKEYGAIYLDTHYHKTNSPGVKVDAPEQTALRLQELLREPDPPDGTKDLALARWSGRGSDNIRFVLHLLIRKLSGQNKEGESMVISGHTDK